MTENSKALTKAKQQLRTMKKYNMPKLSGLRYNHVKKDGSGWKMACDWSGSMAGEKERKLKETIHRVYPEFPGITLIGFADGQAGEFDYDSTDSLHADGGTPMLKALRLCWQTESAQIILITDGYPDESQDRILEEARQHAGTPINTIGIGRAGRDFNAQFLKMLSDITGGVYQNVEEADLAMLPNAVEQLLIEDKTKKDTKQQPTTPGVIQL